MLEFLARPIHKTLEPKYLEQPVLEIAELKEMYHPSGHRLLKVGFVKAFTSEQGSNVKGILQCIFDAITESSCDILLAPQYSLYSVDDIFRQAQGLEIMQAICQSTAQSDMLVVPGTMVYAIENGELGKNSERANLFCNETFAFSNGQI